MPGAYAHYKVGQSVLAQLTKGIRDTAEQESELYNLGLHGPDLLFYYKPYLRTRTSAAGFRAHKKSGREFFTAAAAAAAASENTAAARAYFNGTVCHFALDSLCHPYVEAAMKKQRANHLEIESSLDRALMLADGLDPLCHRPCAHIRPSERSAAIIAPFYKRIPPKTIFAAEKSMLAITDLLYASPLIKRRRMLRLLRMIGLGRLIGGMFIPERDNPNCTESDRALTALCAEAVEYSLRLIGQMEAFLSDGTPLGKEFDHTFGAE